MESHDDVTGTVLSTADSSSGASVRKAHWIPKSLIVLYMVPVIGVMIYVSFSGRYDHTAAAAMPLLLLIVPWRLGVIMWRVRGRSNRAYNVTMTSGLLVIWAGVALLIGLKIRSDLQRDLCLRAAAVVEQNLKTLVDQRDAVLKDLETEGGFQTIGRGVRPVNDLHFELADTLIARQRPLLAFNYVTELSAELTRLGASQSLIDWALNGGDSNRAMVRRSRRFRVEYEMFQKLREMFALVKAAQRIRPDGKRQDLSFTGENRDRYDQLSNEVVELIRQIDQLGSNG